MQTLNPCQSAATAAAAPLSRSHRSHIGSPASEGGERKTAREREKIQKRNGEGSQKGGGEEEDAEDEGTRKRREEPGDRERDPIGEN